MQQLLIFDSIGRNKLHPYSIIKASTLQYLTLAKIVRKPMVIKRNLRKGENDNQAIREPPLSKSLLFYHP